MNVRIKLFPDRLEIRGYDNKTRYFILNLSDIGKVFRIFSETDDCLIFKGSRDVLYDFLYRMSLHINFVVN